MVKDCLAREGIGLIPEDDSTPVQTQVEITKIQPCTKWCKLGSWLKETKGTEERMEKEIEDYLKDPTLNQTLLNGGKSMLLHSQHWLTNTCTCTCMCLCTSSAHQRVFSTSGHVVCFKKLTCL